MFNIFWKTSPVSKVQSKVKLCIFVLKWNCTVNVSDNVICTMYINVIQMITGTNKYILASCCHLRAKKNPPDCAVLAQLLSCHSKEF